MRTHTFRFWMTAAAFTFLGGSVAWAQAGAGAGEGGAGGGGPRHAQRTRAQAQNGQAPGGGQRFAGRFGAQAREEHLEKIQKFVEDLKITDEQKAKVKEVLDNARKQMEEFRTAHKEEVQKLIKEMRDARQAGNSDKAKELAGKLREVMAKAPRPEFLAKLKDVLTPEQMTQLQEKMKELRERIHNRFGGGDGPATRPAPRLRPRLGGGGQGGPKPTP